jgi:subtilisin family serine protease
MTTKLASFLSLIAAFCVLPVSQAHAHDPSFIDNQYIVAASELTSAQLESKVVALGGAVSDDEIDAMGIAVVTSDSPSFRDELLAQPGIDGVGHDAWIGSSADDSGAGDSVTLEDASFPIYDYPFSAAQWGLKAIHAQEAWALGYQGEGALVCDIDTGFDYQHPSLKNNARPDLSRSFVPGEPSVLPSHTTAGQDHGTAVASITAASAGSIRGVAPKAQIMVAKVSSFSGGRYPVSRWIPALRHCADSGAQVINLSQSAWAAIHGYTDSGVWVSAEEVQQTRTAVLRAFNYAERTAVIILAAGNGDGSTTPPAGVDMDRVADFTTYATSPGVVVVSATTTYGFGKDPENAPLDLTTPYSNYGRSWVDVSAPGGYNAYKNADPTSTCTVGSFKALCHLFDQIIVAHQNPKVNGGYSFFMRTSAAAPHAAGVAALIVGKYHGRLAPAQVRSILLRSSDNLGQPGEDPFYGFGRVNARRAVRS